MLPLILQDELDSPTNARKIVETLINVPEQYVQFVDDNVTKHLPEGTHVKGISSYGAAYWTRTAVISTEQADGCSVDFFLKVTHSDVGQSIIRGEFASIKAIHDTLKGFCPVPIATGRYASDPNVHFFLCSFEDLIDEVPDPDTLPAKVALLHKKGISPTGKFGFPVPTSQGALIQSNHWTASWEGFFASMMHRLFNWEQQIHGPDEEMQILSQAVLVKVVPRLLRPLETGGNDIRPSLVHGDLWEGNALTHRVSGKPMVFDASSLYAHNEYELGAWNLPRYQIYRPYIRAYQKLFAISAPEEDVNDRLILYRLRFDLTSSATYLNNRRFRELAVEDMRYLVSKYPNGYEGSEPQKADNDATQVS